MPDITHRDWVQTWAPRLAEAIRCRWPWFVVSWYADGLSIEVGEDAYITGRVELRMPAAERNYLTAVAHISSGMGLSGDLSTVEAGLQGYRALVDALHFSADCLSQVKVWTRPLPCEECDGTGRIQKQRSTRSKSTRPTKCPQCGGTGHRKDPPT